MLTQSIEPNTGLVDFNVEKIDVFNDLFGVDTSERVDLLSRLLFLTDTVNEIRIKERNAEAKREQAKRDLAELKRKRRPR